MADTNYPSATPTNVTPTYPAKKNNTKNILIGVLAAGLLGTWGYFLYDKNKAGDKIESQSKQITALSTDKSELQQDFDNALARLDSVTGANNNLSGENAEMQAKYNKDIDAKKAEIRRILNDKNATASQLAKAKTMIAELNDKITGLETEVARLTGENQELTSANTTLKQEKTDLETNLATRTTEKEELEKTVDVASTFSASNIQVAAVDSKKGGKEKETTKAKRVDKLVVSFDVENRIAKSGPADMYIVVTAPDGKVIAESGNVLSTRADGDKSFTAKVPVNYEQGTRKNIQFPIQQNDFLTGDYKVEIYHNGFKIGQGTRSLKKGGLFS
jgi:peptidoglycan hydrolase CwlO-like protein